MKTFLPLILPILISSSAFAVGSRTFSGQVQMNPQSIAPVQLTIANPATRVGDEKVQATVTFYSGTDDAFDVVFQNATIDSTSGMLNARLDLANNGYVTLGCGNIPTDTTTYHFSCAYFSKSMNRALSLNFTSQM